MAFDLESYLAGGVERMVRGIARAAAKNPRTARFMAEYALTSRRANRLRLDAAARGEHIPPFLIASITTRCNLHCKGCYARANHNCTDSAAAEAQLLSPDDWARIFDEAAELGVAFILLAGGEPFMRPEVLRAAGRQRRIIFPVFTNGTMLSGTGLELVREHPNLMPVLSIEGGADVTDARRGEGTYSALRRAMSALSDEALPFGCSVTVQKSNLHEVMGADFVAELARRGCKVIIYVEYVPVDRATEEQAPGQAEREYMAAELSARRAEFPELLLVSFPGDEQAMGGCLAAGRGFFHINAYGGAEPCPFSAYSDTSLRDTSLREALASPLFVKLRECGALEETHVGGCTLFAQEETVKALCAEGKS